MEYAIEGINNAGTCLGILASDGVVLAAERRVISKLLEPVHSSEKLYGITTYVYRVCSFPCDKSLLILTELLSFF